MTMGSWIWKILLALIGIGLGVFVAEDLIGGALGWTAGGAIIGGCVWPLFKSLIEYRRLKDERLKRGE